MTDIATRVYNHAWKIDPIVRSVLDTDFYKFLMLQFIWLHYRDVPVTFSLINRSTRVRLTEIIDDAVFTRAPIDADGACDLLAQLRTVRRLPDTLSEAQRRLAADFIARFSALAASAPWPRFTLEVNPVKLSANTIAAVDGLLLLE